MVTEWVFTDSRGMNNSMNTHLVEETINIGKEGFLKGLRRRRSWEVGEFLVSTAWEPVVFLELSSDWSP